MKKTGRIYAVLLIALVIGLAGALFLWQGVKSFYIISLDKEYYNRGAGYLQEWMNDEKRTQESLPRALESFEVVLNESESPEVLAETLYNVGLFSGILGIAAHYNGQKELAQQFFAQAVEFFQASLYFEPDSFDAKENLEKAMMFLEEMGYQEMPMPSPDKTERDKEKRQTPPAPQGTLP